MKKLNSTYLNLYRFFVFALILTIFRGFVFFDQQNPSPAKASSTLSWSALGGGTDSSVYAQTIFNGDLIAAGDFSTAGGNPANSIAKWDGSAWSALGEGVDYEVDALTVYDGKLIAAGEFDNAGGSPASNIAQWDGSTWSPLGAGVDSVVYGLTVFDGKLIVGGYFSNAGGNPASCIAQWNGSAWSALGAGTDDGATGLTVYNGKLIAAGDFTSAGGNPAGHIAAWDGANWSTLGAGISYGWIVAVYGTDLIASNGDYDGVSKWNGSAWSALGSGLDGGYPNSFVVFGDKLIAGGYFNTAGGNPAANIAEWDGANWSALGDGFNGTVDSLAVYDNNLIAGGRFTKSGYKTVNYIAQYGPTANIIIGSWEITEGQDIVEQSGDGLKFKELNVPKLFKTIPYVGHSGVQFTDNDRNILVAGNDFASPNAPYYEKMDLDGNILFQKSYNDNPNLGYSQYQKIILGYNNGIIKANLDSAGNIYSPIRPMKAGGNYDLGLCKFDPTGNKDWCSFMSTADYDPGYGSDSTSERSYDTAVYEPDNAVYLFSTGPGISISSNFVISKYNMTTGDREWVVAYPHAGLDELWSGTVDHEGNPIGAGYVAGNGEDWGILKLDPSGNVLWFRQLDQLHALRLRGVQVDANDNVLAAGSQGFVKYDKDGNLLWSTIDGVEYTHFQIDSAGNGYGFGGVLRKMDGDGNLVWSFSPGSDTWSGSVGLSRTIAAVLPAVGGVGQLGLISQGYGDRIVAITTNPIYYSALSGFSADIPAYLFGSVTFQLSIDGLNWYYWNGSAWTLTTGYDGNLATEVNSNISKFSDMHHSPLYVKAIMDSNSGDYQTEFTGIHINYTPASTDSAVLRILPATGAHN